MDLLMELNTRGIVKPPSDMLSTAEVADIHEYLAPQKLWLGSHVPDLASATDITTAEFMANPDYSHGLGCYAINVAINCPHLKQKALQYAWLAKEYFGASPVLFHVNIFWSFPGGPVSPKIQEWHRDLYTFDDKQMAMYFYLSDVDKDAMHSYRCADGRQVNITGPAGTFFIEEPGGLHIGRKPTERCRLMAWARYGVSVPTWNSGLNT